MIFVSSSNQTNQLWLMWCNPNWPKHVLEFFPTFCFFGAKCDHVVFFCFFLGVGPQIGALLESHLLLSHLFCAQYLCYIWNWQQQLLQIRPKTPKETVPFSIFQPSIFSGSNSLLSPRWKEVRSKCIACLRRNFRFQMCCVPWTYGLKGKHPECIYFEK